MAGAGLHLLPNELLERIVRHLDNIATIRNLTQCSRTCYLLFLPFLYRTVRILDAPKSTSLRTFAKAILTHRTTAQYVQSFTFRKIALSRHDIEVLRESWLERQKSSQSRKKYNESDFLQQLLFECGQDVRQVGPDFQDLCSRAITSKGLILSFPKEEWIKSIAHAEEDALVTLVIAMMPNLRYLDTTVPHSTDYGLLTREPRIQERSMIPHNYFKNLVRVTVCLDKAEGFHPKDDAGINLLLFHILNPSTQEVRFKNLATHPPDAICERTWLPEIPPNSSSVSHIELRDFNIHSSNVAEIVAGCQKLQSFIFEHPKMYWGPSRIAAVLQGTQDSLEDLWLGFGPLQWQAANYREPMGSLKKFTSLRRVRLSMRLIFTTLHRNDYRRCLVDFLPPSIELLHLNHCNYKFEELTEALSELFEQQPSVLPSLRHVIIDAPLSVIKELYLEDYFAMIKIAESNGVYFTNRDTTQGFGYRKKGWGWYETEEWYEEWLPEASYRSRRAVYPQFTVRPARRAKGVLDEYLGISSEGHEVSFFQHHRYL